MLKALGQKLMALKEEFYAESLATGATRADGWIDIEGGTGTLLAYASKARRELPNTRVLTDGDVEPLSKDGTFSAQHILTPARRRRRSTSTPSTSRSGECWRRWRRR